jgi:hypothetical protein
MGLFLEEAIINALKSLLAGRVNEILSELEEHIQPIEFSEKQAGGFAARPEIRFAECERTEKERIIRFDAYAVTVALAGSERDCYGYASAIAMALGEDVTLGGTIDRAALVHKKYIPPKRADCGEDWEVVLSLRLTVEGKR